MICSSIGRDLGLGFLYIVTRAMGCFFGCFRVRENHQSRLNLACDPVPSRAREHASPGNHLASLFLSDESEGSPSKDKGNEAWGSVHSGVNVKGLKDEAKFLKACGTLVETPAEIRKLSRISERYPANGNDSDPSNFHSWLPTSAIAKLNYSEQPDNIPTPVKICEDWGKVSSSSEETPSSCVSDDKSSRVTAPSSSGGCGMMENSSIGVHPNQTDLVPVSLATPSSSVHPQSRNKSVRFDCEPATPFDFSSSSSSEVVSEYSKKARPSDSFGVPKPSPYPTPLKLHESMQTPGTVFPANQNTIHGMNARIRSQYVYSVLNPIENYSQWEALKEEESNSYQLSGQERESLERPEEALSMAQLPERENSEFKDLKVEASLSAWLKPLPPSGPGKNQHIGESRIPPFGRTPSDRPILGTVATHWNEEELSHQVSPKWWDGNGIPNSTNKYKEDQKVSWHATPFEERLEKALSEETYAPQRRLSGTPLTFNESDECDTAMSQMKSPVHTKTVVSC